MEQIKQLTNTIDQATSDMLTQPTPSLYSNVQKLLAARADMSKHLISYVSKRLMIKNKKVLFLTMDLLQYLSYQTELSFYSQIATKDFLMIVSRLLQSKDIDQAVINKILCVVKCWEELFRPHQDLLPMFFQFYDGLTKKGFESKSEYVSPYRPRELKKYPTKTQQKRPSSVRRQDSRNQPKKQPVAIQPQSLSNIKDQITLTNEVIDGCDPAQGVTTNPLLNDLLSGLKEAQKLIIKTINQSTNEKVIEQAIALNDDLIITFRRYKDLQKNKKPEPFVKTELASQFTAPINSSPQQPALRNPPLKKPPSIFQEFDMPSKNPPPKRSFSPMQVPKPKPPQPVANLMDLDFEPPQSLQQFRKPTVAQQAPRPAVQPASGTNIFDLMDIQSSPPLNTSSPPPQRRPSLNSGALNLLGAPQPAPVAATNYGSNSGLAFNSGINQQPFNFGTVGLPPDPVPITNINFMAPPTTAPMGIGMAAVGTLPSNPMTFDSLPYKSPPTVDMKQYHENNLTDLSDWFSKK